MIINIVLKLTLFFWMLLQLNLLCLDCQELQRAGQVTENWLSQAPEHVLAAGT